MDHPACLCRPMQVLNINVTKLIINSRLLTIYEKKPLVRTGTVKILIDLLPVSLIKVLHPIICTNLCHIIHPIICHHVVYIDRNWNHTKILDGKVNLLPCCELISHKVTKLLQPQIRYGRLSIPESCLQLQWIENTDSKISDKRLVEDKVFGKFYSSIAFQ